MTAQPARQDMLAQSRATWADYERLKAEWQSKHPKASTDEYAAACRRIADELGL